jgi:NAD(P)H dehydrogenase (quinone)
MHVHVVYVHPSEDSFTSLIRDAVLRGLADGGHTCTVSDLYRMNFKTDMSEAEYQREGFYRLGLPLPDDVRAEQDKIMHARALIFVYPVFWTEAPAKLIGWFDRVWTVGFAYEECSIPELDNVLFLAVAGNSAEKLEVSGAAAAMRTVMINDRINTRSRKASLHIFDGMSRGMETRSANAEAHLRKAYLLARSVAE